MRFLAVNDDGIDALGIRLTTVFLQKKGEVTVCAPAFEQSGKSHSVNFKNEIRVEKRSFPNASEAYAVHSVPADCVRFGHTALQRTYDLVVSGMNHGENLGDDMVYSGTLGAVEEASFFRTKAVALSARTRNLESAATYFPAIWDFFVRNRLFDYCDFYNVNIPADPKGFRFTKMGGAYYTDRFTHLRDDVWIQKGVFAYNPSDDLLYDTNANGAGYITITPLTVNRTDLPVLKQLQEIDDLSL